MHSFRLSLASVLLLALAAAGRAEMPPQPRETATHVVIGTAQRVYRTRDVEHDYYLVALRVEEVERGAGLAKGDLVYIPCFVWARRSWGMVGAAGHWTIPETGDRLRAFLQHGHGHYGALYPDWADVLEPGPTLTADLVLDWFSWATYLVVALVGLALGWWWARRRAARRAAVEPAHSL